AGFLARLQVVAPRSELSGVEAALRADPGIASVGHAQLSDGVALLSAIPRAAPSTSELSRTIDRVRSELPAGAVIGGGRAGNYGLEGGLSARGPHFSGA